MEKMYSIGETAKIMGISVQTLRNYSKFPFLQPAYINEETGYRYYSFEQFHIIDRIKYLRSLNLSLTEIEEIMMNGEKVEKIITFLENREKNLDKEIEELLVQKENVRWYIDYFKYVDQLEDKKRAHITRYEKRKVLYTKCSKDETIEDIEVRLAKKKIEYAEYGLKYRRQFGYLLDYDSVVNREWEPKGYFTYISNYQEARQVGVIPENTDIIEFPAGDYLCFSFRIYHLEELNVNLIKEYIKNGNKPIWVFANEHEDNLVSYKSCPYELQIFYEN